MIVKKRIGIITFHASYNCGSMLQAYALQNILKDRYGVECEIINFSNSEQKRMYSILYWPRKIKDVFRNVLNLIFYKKIKNHNADYIAFLKNNLLLSKEQYNSIGDLEKMQLDYDIYITGSDQVWNIKAQDFDDAYFLPFINRGKKLAYAVSLGATNPNHCCEDDKDKYAKYMNSFDAISVREKNAQKWIHQLSGRNIEICVDPTLLMEPSAWNKIIGPQEIKGRYIFWYTMIYYRQIRDIVAQIGKKYNMPVYVLDAKEWSRRGLYLRGIHLARNGGPSSFLSLVKNAEIVITSSFHGSVFCSVFKKNFWYINIHDKDSDDDRASYLLNQLGMKSRYIKIQDIMKTDLMIGPIFSDKELIDSAKKNSYAFLDQYCL